MTRDHDQGAKLRIVYFTHYTKLYGANRSLLNLLEGFSRNKNMELLLVAPSEGQVLDRARNMGIQCLVLPFYNEIFLSVGRKKAAIFFSNLAKVLLNVWLVLRYYRKIKGRGKTIIHSNSSVTLIGAYFAFFLRLEHVWHIREFVWDDYRLGYGFGRKYFEFWVKRASAVVCVSQAIYDRRVKPLNLPRSRVIYNGVVFEHQLDCRDSHSRSREDGWRATFAIAGGVMASKNVQVAVEAFVLVRETNENARLLIVGDWQDEAYIAQLETIIREKGLGKNVEFTGFVDDMSVIYKNIDVLLMCSHHEALGRVTIEAMSYGVPVIGYNAAGTKEIIVDNYNGLLYTGGYVELAERMQWIISQQNLVEQMHRNCILSVRKNFTIEQYMSNVYNLYAGVLG